VNTAKTRARPHHISAQRHAYLIAKGLCPSLCPTPIGRFWGYVQKTDACWLWTGPKFKTGYGWLGIGQRKVRAHRFMYESLHGPIPKPLVLDHLCRVPLCVNPDHLEAVTDFVNVMERSMNPKAITFRTDICARGHQLDALETYGKTGRRWCRECVRIRQREAYRTGRWPSRYVWRKKAAAA
jgi:hypothetical protein